MTEELLIILHDGQELMRGKAEGIRVIFNNLTGKNPLSDYPDYLRFVCQYTNTEIDTSKLELKGIEEAHGQTTTEPL